MDLIPYPDFTAPNIQGKVQKMEAYISDFVPRYNLLVQEINRILEKEKQNGVRY